MYRVKKNRCIAYILCGILSINDVLKTPNKEEAFTELSNKSNLLLS